MRWYITVDETWIHHYTPETKEQSKQWVFEGERGPKKTKTMKSPGKVKATGFRIGLLRKRTSDNWSVLCVVIALAEQRNQEKMSSFEKDPLPSRQCTGAHVRSSDGQNGGIKIRINKISTVFAGFVPRGLLNFQTWKNSSPDNGSRQTRRSSPKQMPILKIFRNPIFSRA